MTEPAEVSTGVNWEQWYGFHLWLENFRHLVLLLDWATSLFVTGKDTRQSPGQYKRQFTYPSSPTTTSPSTQSTRDTIRNKRKPQVLKTICANIKERKSRISNIDISHFFRKPRVSCWNYRTLCKWNADDVAWTTCDSFSDTAFLNGWLVVNLPHHQRLGPLPVSIPRWLHQLSPPSLFRSLPSRNHPRICPRTFTERERLGAMCWQCPHGNIWETASELARNGICVQLLMHSCIYRPSVLA